MINLKITVHSKYDYQARIQTTATSALANMENFVSYKSGKPCEKSGKCCEKPGKH